MTKKDKKQRPSPKKAGRGTPVRPRLHLVRIRPNRLTEAIAVYALADVQYVCLGVIAQTDQCVVTDLKGHGIHFAPRAVFERVTKPEKARRAPAQAVLVADGTTSNAPHED